jgi:hypothetical protein
MSLFFDLYSTNSFGRMSTSFFLERYSLTRTVSRAIVRQSRFRDYGRFINTRWLLPASHSRAGMLTVPSCELGYSVAASD